MKDFCKIPVYHPSLVGNEKKYVNECLNSNWISSKGKFVQKFETIYVNMMADWVGDMSIFKPVEEMCNSIFNF